MIMDYEIFIKTSVVEEEVNVHMGVILWHGIKYHDKIITRVNFVNIFVNINNFLLTVKMTNGEQEATVFLWKTLVI